MRKITGGYYGTSTDCKTGPCTVYVQAPSGGNNYWAYPGNCEITFVPNGYGATPTCRCSAFGGDHITSNDGVSHCVI